MPRLRPLKLQADSPLIGEPCALCQSPFEVGDKLIICPEDGVRHHVHCWEANHNHCVALGCTGSGRVSGPAHTAVAAQNPAPVTITEDDPLLDPANIPDRPIPRQNGWKSISSWLRGCLIFTAVAFCLLCLLLTITLYPLLTAS